MYSESSIAAKHCALLNLCRLYRKIETAQNIAKAITEMGVNLIDYDSTWTGENKNYIIETWTGAINADKIQPKN